MYDIQVIAIDKGHITVEGTYKELLKTNPDIFKIIEEEEKQQEEEDELMITPGTSPSNNLGTRLIQSSENLTQGTMINTNLSKSQQHLQVSVLRYSNVIQYTFCFNCNIENFLIIF